MRVPSEVLKNSLFVAWAKMLGTDKLHSRIPTSRALICSPSNYRVRLFCATRLGFVQPAAPQRFGRNARQVRFEIENRRSVEHVDATNMQGSPLATEQFDYGESNRVWSSWRVGCENAVRTIVNGGSGNQLESFGAIEYPQNK